MFDPLSVILSRFDAREPRFSGDDVAAWRKGMVEYLAKCGLLREVEPATSVICDACADRHVEEVVMIKKPPGSIPRFYIHCPENGRVFVSKERLRQWEINFFGLAKGLARALDLAGSVEEIVLERIWFLGRTTLAAQSRELFLACGLTWEDACDVLGKSSRINAAKSALVLVAGEVPPASVWNGEALPIVAVKTVTRIKKMGLAVDRIHLESLLADRRKKIPCVTLKAFPTPVEIIWADIRIVVAETKMSIVAKGKRRQYTFAEAGFEERRKRNMPNCLWGILKSFAMYGGILPFKAVEEKKRSNFKQYVSVLRERIRALIPGIDGDMILYDKRENCYKTLFRISSEESLQFPTPDGTAWADITVFPNGFTGIRICVTTTERFAVSGYADRNDASTHQWEGAEREGMIERNYDFRMLHLVDDQDRPNRAGQALLTVLSNNGIVKRKAEDKGMQELCGVLSKLMMGIAGSPFEFIPFAEKWVARFEIGDGS
ncbi:MAG: hypothetical protein PHV34_01855 [Verrucomicrobiae bacterium]|nr:hypothetical protein [Verrucomicrobiae bacterium]